jgi:CheY-like chemotaxis protein
VAEPLAGIRIVISEDYDDTRQIVEGVLRDDGATVTAVASAREALALVDAADIVITDYRMPHEDGVWLLEQVNKQPRPIPVIAMSAFAERQIPRLAQAPFARKLLKPVDPWELGHIIREVLRKE